MRNAIAILLVVFCLCSFIACKDETLKGTTKADNTTTDVNDTLLTDENFNYLKGIDQKISISILGSENEKTFLERMGFVAENYFSVAANTDEEIENANKYFSLTRDIVADYEKCNDKIDVRYVEPDSTEDLAYRELFSNDRLICGDIVVEATVGGKRRAKIVNFVNIYVTSEGPATYYGPNCTITGNKLESALTSAIAYVTNTENKKVAILSGHSPESSVDSYIEALDNNFYEVTEISTTTIDNVSNEFDVVVISVPTTDFMSAEIDALNKFLNNDGKLGKGLVFFTDATAPYLPNLYGFLEQWGISIKEGIIFETNSYNAFDKTNTTLGTFQVAFADDTITEGIGIGAITNNNVPMKACVPSDKKRQTKALMQTLDTTVIAPKGVTAAWTPSDSDVKQQFDTVIQSVETKSDATSYVMAFASIEYIQSAWGSHDAEYSNRNIVMACIDRAAHLDDMSMTFLTKVVD